MPLAGRKPPRFDLLRHNLGMARALEDYLAPSFGPGGRGKLFLDPKGTPIPTMDGARILEILESPHPVARVVSQAARSQSDEWGDGTKRAAILTLRLLRRAEGLLDAGVPPARIVRGYEIGLELATEGASRIARTADPEDAGFLLEVARASIGGGLPSGPRDELAEAVVGGALQVAIRAGNGWRCDRDDIHVFPKVGSGFAAELVHGYLLERTRDDPNMPAKVEGARIALFDAAPIRGKAGVHEPRLRWVGESKVLLKSPGELEQYVNLNAKLTAEVVDALRGAKANVVLCRLGISDHGHKLLARAGILGIRTIMRTKYMVAVARATGAQLIKDFREVRPEQLGRAGLVEERRFGESKSLVISRCPNPRVVSLVILGPGTAVAGDFGAIGRKAVGAVVAAIEDPRWVVGGSGAEVATARAVRDGAYEVEGREQLAVVAFADALEDFARCLATNLGMNPLDALLELRRLNGTDSSWGLSAGDGKPVRWDAGPVKDPLAPQLAAWGRAVDATRTVLRVDDFRKRAGKREPNVPKEDGSVG